MVVDFSHQMYPEKPVLVLEDVDETPIQTLGYAFGLIGTFNFNEISTLEFDLPAYVEGVKTPHYDDVVGLRLVDLVGWGRFVLMKPKISKSGIREVKHCTAYSIEYEWADKKMGLTEDVYALWSPVNPSSSLLGIILSYLPSWRAGYISSELLSTYRNISTDYKSIYDFVKSDVQIKYGCVFDFDTYNRVVNVYSTKDNILTKGIFVSTQNLAKNIDVEEDTEDIITALDVNGAEGVDIRMVNPMGINKMYNLDYFINAGMMSDTLAEKWNLWKQTFAARQNVYYSLAIEYYSQQSDKLTLEMAQKDYRSGALATQKELLAVKVSYLASLVEGSEEYTATQDEIDEINTTISELNASIDDYQDEIDADDSALDSILDQMEAINRETSFYYTDEHGVIHYNFGFTEEDITTLHRFFKEDSINESSFVASTTKSYVSDGITATNKTVSVNITTSYSGEQYGVVSELADLTGKRVFTVNSGTITLTNDVVCESQIINVVAQLNDDHTCIVSGYLNSGNVLVNGGNASFQTGYITIRGAWSLLDTDVAETETPSILEGSYVSFRVTNADFYFTTDTTAFTTYSVEHDLYQYGYDALQKLAWPSYSFSVDSANFLTLEDYQSFAERLELGKRVYIDLDSFGVLEPILVSVHIEFDHPASMQLDFGSTFNLSDSSFALADLLDQGISMGKRLDTNRVNYNAFVNSGASNTVRNYINSSLDVAKQTILSGSDIAVSWDSSGFWLRKKNNSGAYENEQIGMINNSIVFTDDGWQSAKMAIGKFTDKNLGASWGVVAPSIVGTLLAGESLYIESTKSDGDILAFRVDGNGASLHNADFSLFDNTATGDYGHIEIGAMLGIIGGVDGSTPLLTYDSQGIVDGVATHDGDSVTSISDLNVGDEPNANFWIDMNGDVWLRGNVNATDGVFRGTVYANDGIFQGIVQASDFLDASGNSILNDQGQFDESALDLSGLGIFVSPPTEDGTVTVALLHGDGSTSTEFGTLSINGNVDINGSLSADALYATKGDIADLTVDALSTSRRILKYLTNDRSDDNYIRIKEQTIAFVTGEQTPPNEYQQAYNPNGQPLYWEQEVYGVPGLVVESNLPPRVDGKPVYITTVQTGFPVYVFKYKELLKREISFQLETTSSGERIYVPVDVFGAGTTLSANAPGRGYIIKEPDGLHIKYQAENQKWAEIHWANDGFLDFYGLRRPLSLDCSDWPEYGSSGTIYEYIEGIDTPIPFGVSVSRDGSTITFSYGDNKQMVVTMPPDDENVRPV